MAEDCALHPVKFVRAIAREAEKLGATIFEGTEVLSTSASEVSTESHAVKAKHVIVATESQNKRRFADAQVRREIAVVTEEIPSETWKKLGWDKGGMFWTAGGDYISARKIGSRLFINGSCALDPSAAELDAAQEKTLAVFLGFFPNLPKEKLIVSHRWTGLLMYPNRNLPFVTNENGYWELFGCGGNGLTNGIMLGKIIAEHFSGNEIPEMYRENKK